jgi:transposase-like protein
MYTIGMETLNNPYTLLEAVRFFGHYPNCHKFMIEVRWSDGVVKCPKCDSDHVSYLEKTRVYKCYAGHKSPKFSLKVGTIFEDSPIGLEKWLPAVWLLSVCKNGISSYELHRALGVTQKTAWFMLHRIRKAMQTGSFMKLAGEVEVDETFIGGLSKNMHEYKREANITGTGGKDKTPVLGCLERGGKVIATVIPNRKRKTLHNLVREQVAGGSSVYTDALASYDGLGNEYDHQFVDHAVEYVRGRVHTNGLENFWSLLKRTVKGTYVSVEPFHLVRYLDEQTFRYNERHGDDAQRFSGVMKQTIGRRITYKELIGDVE